MSHQHQNPDGYPTSHYRSTSNIPQRLGAEVPAKSPEPAQRSGTNNR
jgi:hypothetical protein